jgi:hypothetical protein
MISKKLLITMLASFTFAHLFIFFGANFVEFQYSEQKLIMANNIINWTNFTTSDNLSGKLLMFSKIEFKKYFLIDGH